MSEVTRRAAKPDESEERLHWLALRLVPGLGLRGTLRLVRTLGSATAVFQADPSELESLGITSEAVREISTGAVFEAAHCEMEQARQAGVSFITLNDAEYPALLKEIFDPPLLLYLQGDASLLSQAAIAIVGSRRPTAYGRGMASKLAGELAARGLAIISGLARGIDSAAHTGTLDAGGKTIAVLGCGIDVVYPSENKKLYATIAEKGLLVSEFPLGDFPAPQNFPIRNRVISGLSLGVIVVEAAEHSGSLITARLAMDQNREVFGVPGSITNKYSWGPHLLIKQGAKLVQDWQDVVDELPTPVREGIIAPLLAAAATKAASGASVSAESLSAPARSIFGLLNTDQAVHIDDLLAALPSLSSSELLAHLLEMEFQGLVRQMPGKNFVKKF